MSQQGMTSEWTGKKKSNLHGQLVLQDREQESDWTLKRRVRRLLLHWGVN